MARTYLPKPNPPAFCREANLKQIPAVAATERRLRTKKPNSTGTLPCFWAKMAAAGQPAGIGKSGKYRHRSLIRDFNPSEKQGIWDCHPKGIPRFPRAIWWKIIEINKCLKHQAAMVGVAESIQSPTLTGPTDLAPSQLDHSTATDECIPAAVENVVDILREHPHCTVDCPCGLWRCIYSTIFYLFFQTYIHIYIYIIFYTSNEESEVQSYIVINMFVHPRFCWVTHHRRCGGRQNFPSNKPFKYQR